MTREEAARMILSIVENAHPPPDLELAPAHAKKTARKNSDAREKEPRPKFSDDYSAGAINRDYSLVIVGAKAMVIKDQRDGPIEDRLRILTVDAFCQWFADKFTELEGLDGKRRAISWGRRWLMDKDRRKYAGLEFFPNPDGAQGCLGYLNLWRGFAVEPSTRGSWDLYRDHLLNNICDGKAELYNWLFAWFAHLVQRPRERPGTALVLRGGMGVGKSIVGEVIGALIPAHYFQVGSSRYVVSNFNLHLAKCLLLQSDEAVWAGDKHAEGTLKDLVTSATLMIEAKGIDAIRMPNRVRLMMTSNDDWVAPAGHGERRFGVFDVNPRCMKNYEYFGDMRRELESGGYARLLYDLQHFDLSKINLREIPRTPALLEQQLRTLDPLDAWWLDRLMEGTPTRQINAWPSSVSIETLYADYLKAAEEIGASRRRDRATFGVRLGRIARGIERVRSPREAGERRGWRYRLPSLADCRAAFEQELGQPIGWGEPDEEKTTQEEEESDVIGF